jgi:hypothetical protein
LSTKAAEIHSLKVLDLSPSVVKPDSFPIAVEVELFPFTVNFESIASNVEFELSSNEVELPDFDEPLCVTVSGKLELFPNLKSIISFSSAEELESFANSVKSFCSVSKLKPFATGKFESLTNFERKTQFVAQRWRRRL